MPGVVLININAEFSLILWLGVVIFDYTAGFSLQPKPNQYFYLDYAQPLSPD